MSKRVAKMSKIDINHKFYDQEEACKYAKRLVKAIDFICKRENISVVVLLVLVI